MSRTSARALTEAELLSLVSELLDAHADTIQIGTAEPEELPWQAHLDYLRALQRQGKEMLARWHPPAGGIESK